MDCPVCQKALTEYRKVTALRYTEDQEKMLLSWWHQQGHPDLNKQP